MKDIEARLFAHVEKVSVHLSLRDLPQPHSPARVRRLSGHRDSVLRLAALPRGGRIVTACDDCRVRVYRPTDCASSPQLEHVLDVHTDWVRDVTPLEGDIVASVGDDSRVVTWDATRGKYLDSLQLSGWHCFALTRVAPGMLAVADDSDIVWIRHEHGRNLARVARSPRTHDGNITTMHAHADYLFVAAEDCCVSVWDISTRRRVARLPQPGDPDNPPSISLDVNDTHIVVGSHRSVRVYANKPGFPLRGVVHGLHGRHHITSVHLIGDSLLLTAAKEDHCIVLSDLRHFQIRARLSAPIPEGIELLALAPGGHLVISNGEQVALICLPNRCRALDIVRSHAAHTLGFLQPCRPPTPLATRLLSAAAAAAASIAGVLFKQRLQ